MLGVHLGILVDRFINVVEKNERKGGAVSLLGGSIVALLHREDGIVMWCLFVVDIV
jgi:hypothetical protein